VSEHSVFGNKIPGRTFGRKRMLQEDGKLSNEKLHNLFFLPDIMRKIKLSRRKWTGRVTNMG
jgi:hypothetical protein